VESAPKIQKDICLKVVAFSHGVYPGRITGAQDDDKKCTFSTSIIIFSPTKHKNNKYNIWNYRGAKNVAHTRDT
jgi:hypothetical protein